MSGEMAAGTRPELLPGHNPFRDALGVEPRLGPGPRACLRLAIDGRHRDETGRVHPGVLAALIDLAMGHAVLAARAEVGRPITVALHMSVRERPRRGVLYARGRLVTGARGLWWPTAEIRTGGGVLVARGDGPFIGRAHKADGGWRPAAPSGTVQADGG